MRANCVRALALIVSVGSLALTVPGVAQTGGYSALPIFTRAPSVSKAADGKMRIEFSVSTETDVAVWVLDAKGEVVRHLVAGVLGAKSPAPLKPGLTQSIEWDGRDDDGKLAAGGPFKARVSAGLKPEFDSFIFYNPDTVPRVKTLACLPDGEVCVFYTDATANVNQGGLKIKLLDREGRSRRMLMPYPADIDYERVKPMGAFQDEAGRLVPQIHSWQMLSFYPDPCGTMRQRSRIGFPVADSKGTLHWMMTTGRLASLDAEGGSPYPTFMSEKLFLELKEVTGSPVLCVGGEDRYLYVSGLMQADDRWGKNKRDVPCVYRVDLKTRAPATPFIGKPDASDSKDGLLVKPMGIACAKGLLYVVDAGSDRVLAYKESDGSLAGELKVSSPRFVNVDPRSGAMYVVCAKPAVIKEGKGKSISVMEPDLLKFENIQSGKEICRVTLPKDTHTKVVRHHISLDCSEGPARLWTTILEYQRERICRIDDTGSNLMVKDDFRQKHNSGYLGGRELFMDRRCGELRLRSTLLPEKQNYFRMNENSGEISKVGDTRWFEGLGVNGGEQLSVCSDGSLVSLGNRRGLMRWTHDAKPLPWEGAPDNGAKNTGVMNSLETQGPLQNMTIFKDEMYLVLPTYWRKGIGKTELTTSLNVHGMDGKPRRTVIWQCTPRAIVRFDAKGNLYLVDTLRPKGRLVPEFFDGKRELIKAMDPYVATYGSVVKFPPEGGAIWYDEKGKTVATPEYAVGEMPKELLQRPSTAISYPGQYCRSVASTGSVQGAEWVRMGAAYYYKWNGGDDSCQCENTGFDVDAFGRVFYPNLGQFRVEMVDTSNNWIGTFGHYGNQDSIGGGKFNPRSAASGGTTKDGMSRHPDIPLAWPTEVAVSDRYAYISDAINLRVVKVRLNYAAEATCEVK